MRKKVNMYLMCIGMLFSIYALSNCSDSDKDNLTGIKISQGDITINVGETLQLDTEITPEGVSVSNITWYTSDVAIATVSKDGKVTGIGIGDVVIIARTSSGFQGSITATVRDKREEIATTYSGKAKIGSNTSGIETINLEFLAQKEQFNIQFKININGLEYNVSGENITVSEKEDGSYELFGNVMDKNQGKGTIAGTISENGVMDVTIELNNTSILFNGRKPYTHTAMSFNVYYTVKPGDIADWDYRKAAIVSMIKKEKPTTIGMQEVRKNPQLNYFDAELTDYARIGIGRDGGEAGDYSAIYYRKDILEVIETGDFWMSETPDVPSIGWDASHRRLTTWGRFKVIGTGTEVLIYNTHLDHNGVIAVEESIKMMKEHALTHLTTSTKSVLMTGDFNEESFSTAFAPFNGFLGDCREDSPKTDRTATTNSWGNFTGKEESLDHVFYRNCIPVRFKVLNDSYAGIEILSDHYPIKAVLEIPAWDEN